MFGRVPKNGSPFLGTRSNISESDSEISTRVPICIAQVRVGTSVARVLVADNVVTGASSATTCVNLEGATSTTRATRDNVCW